MRRILWIFLVSACGFAQTQIQPSRDIAWPANCSALLPIYSVPGAVCVAGGLVPLSALLPATANATLNHGGFTQTWNWNLTGAANGLVLAEGAAGSGTGDLVQINGLSGNTNALSVLSGGTNLNQIHFGPNDSLGGWLVAASNGDINLTSNAKIVGGSWSALSATPAEILIGGGKVQFFADSGKTIGAAFAPTQIAGITTTPSGGSSLSLGPSAHGGSVWVDSAPNLQLLGGAYVDSNGNSIASATSAAAVILGPGLGGGTFFYSATGLTLGNSFSFTNVAHIDSAGSFVGAGLNVSGNSTVGSETVTGNHNVSGNETVARLGVNSGIYNAGGGLKHQRFTSCTTAAGANGTCAGSLTWTTAFVDASYTVSCTSGMSSTQMSLLSISGRNAAGVSYWIMTLNGALAASYSIDCIAMHD